MAKASADEPKLGATRARFAPAPTVHGSMAKASADEPKLGATRARFAPAPNAELHVFAQDAFLCHTQLSSRAGALRLYERNLVAAEHVAKEHPRSRWRMAQRKLAAVRALAQPQALPPMAAAAAPAAAAPATAAATPPGPGCHGLALFATVNGLAQRYVAKMLKAKWGVDAQKQAEAMQAWSKGHDEALEAECELSTLADGNVACYTPAALLKRRHAFEHPRVQELLDQWWGAATRHHDADGDGQLDREEYAGVYSLLVAAFAVDVDDDDDDEEDEEGDDGDAAAAAATLEADWLRDAGEDGVVDKEEFKASIFELADQWTESCSAAEYVSFLEELFLRVFHGAREREQSNAAEGDAGGGGWDGASGAFLSGLEEDEARLEAGEAGEPALRAAFLELPEQARRELREGMAGGGGQRGARGFDPEQEAEREGYSGFAKQFRNAHHVAAVHPAYAVQAQRVAQRIAARYRPPGSAAGYHRVVQSAFKPFRARKLPPGAAAQRAAGVLPKL